MRLETIRVRRRATPVALMLAPMVDVVFQLLIFFLCTNEWRRPEGAIRADLPTGAGRAREEKPPERRDLPFIRIELTGAGDDVRLKVQERPVPDVEGLTQALVRLAAIDPTVPVIVDAEGPIGFRWVIAALNACLKADLKNVAFTAPPGSPPS